MNDQSEILRAFLEVALTRPMTVVELAGHFGVGRHKMRAILAEMRGTERCGSLWRVPVKRMPPSYISQIWIDLDRSGKDTPEAT